MRISFPDDAELAALAAEAHLEAPESGPSLGPGANVGISIASMFVVSFVTWMLNKCRKMLKVLDLHPVTGIRTAVLSC